MSTALLEPRHGAGRPVSPGELTDLRPARRTLPRRRPAGGTLLAAGLLAVAAWIVSGFWSSVELRSPRAPYPAPTAGQQWVRAPAQWPRAFFRLRVPLASHPRAATLFLEASQQVTPYVDGLRVAEPPRSPNEYVDTANDLPPVYLTLDLAAALRPGANVLGLEVVSDDGGTPEFRARLVIDTSGGETVLGTSPASWRATTDVALTSQLMPQSGAFSLPDANDGDWAPAVPGSAATATADTVPPDAYLSPATRPALAGTPGAATLRASTRVDVPAGCDEAWMRVAATGPYSVALDGRVIATGSGGPERFGDPDTFTSSTVETPKVLQLAVYDLCPVVRSGSHLLSVTVSASTVPAIYLDGIVRAPGGTVVFGTGPGWVGGTGTSAAGPLDILPAPQQNLYPFERAQSAVLVASLPLLGHRLALALELLAAVGGALVAARLAGRGATASLRAAAAGALPAVGLVLVLIETEHIIAVRPPFPDTPGLLDLVLLLAGGGVVAALLVSSPGPRWARRRPLAAQPAATAPPAASPPAASPPAAEPRRGEPEAPPSPRSLHRAGRWVRLHPYQAGIAAFTVAWAAVQCYDLGFEPMWQDELSSLGAAQAVRAHLLPRWPSGFLYWKSELYSAVIAVVGFFAHDDVAWLRSVSTVFFAGTVALFGLGLAPLVLPRRRVAQAVSTVLFATAPFELGHARDVRMYQMAQFFVVLLALLLWRALREPSTRHVAAAMAAVVAMYLSHEETFGVLPVVPIVLVASFGWRFARNWRWWVFGGAASFVILVQLALAYLTHPPAFGIDASSGSLVGWSPAPFFYIDQFFFTRVTSGASITIVSTLALVGVAVGLRRRIAERCYVLAFLAVPVVVVTFLLPAKDTRYAFVTLPFDFALAGAGACDVLDAVAGVVLHRGARPAPALHRLMHGVFAGFVALAVALSLIGGIGDYGVLVARVTGSNYAHRWFDYPRADAYVKAHLRPGDGVIAAATPDLVADSLHSALVGWIPYHRSSTLLYLIEEHGQAVDTEYGLPAILNGNDFEISIDSRRRTWLIVADNNISGLLPAERAVIESRFRLVEEGEDVSVFLATT